MVLNRSSLHYKIWVSSFSNYSDIPDTTNLCSYCQRVFFSGILWLTVIAVAATIAATMLYGIFYIGFWEHTKIAFIVLGAIVGAIALTISVLAWKYSLEYSEPGLVRQWMKAKKSRVCPIVEFE